METKKCSCCKLDKPKSDFGECKKSSDGLRWECKLCKNEKSRLSRLKNKKPRKTKWDFQYREFNCECCGIKVSGNLSTQKKYCNDNCGKKAWAKRNEDKVIEWRKNYILNNPEKVLNTKRKYTKNNPEKVKLNSKRQSEKLEVRIKNALRSRVKEALKNNQKKGGTLEIIGCSVSFLKQHIEKQFVDGMSWENWGFTTWHIDHIKPLSKAKDIDEMYELCHYTNLQPLWAEDNLKKSNKVL